MFFRDVVFNAAKSPDGWDRAAQIATIAGGLTVLVGAVLAWYQFRESRFRKLNSQLQTEKMRSDRRILLVVLANRSYPWGQDETNSAEIVCHTFNSAAFACARFQRSYFSRDEMIRLWGVTVLRCRIAAEPHIAARRAKDLRVWEYFDHLCSDVLRHPKWKAAGLEKKYEKELAATDLLPKQASWTSKLTSWRRG